MVNIPPFEYWFAGTTWVAALAFMLAAILCWLEFKDMNSENKMNCFKTLISVAILFSVFLAWWAAAVQEYQLSPQLEIENESIEADENNIFTVIKTTKVMSPFTPNALFLTVWANFEEEMEIDSLDTVALQSYKYKNNNNSFHGRKIVNPTGRYKLIIKTKNPEQINIEWAFQ